MRICSVEGCIRASRRTKLCEMHYSRLRRHGDVGSPDPTRHKRGKVCMVGGCDKEQDWRGMCPMHRYRVQKYGTTTLPVVEAIGAQESPVDPEPFLDWVCGELLLLGDTKMSTRRVAERIGVSPRTINRHRRHLEGEVK